MCKIPIRDDNGNFTCLNLMNSLKNVYKKVLLTCCNNLLVFWKKAIFSLSFRNKNSKKILIKIIVKSHYYSWSKYCCELIQELWVSVSQLFDLFQCWSLTHEIKSNHFRYSYEVRITNILCIQISLRHSLFPHGVLVPTWWKRTFVSFDLIERTTRNISAFKILT